MTACASEAPTALNDTTAGAQDNDASNAEPGESPAEGDYAFGTDRDQMATAIEAAFDSSNGKARWDAGVLVLEVDGDADDAMAGFMECRVLEQLLLEEDAARVQFPNGSVECAEVLED